MKPENEFKWVTNADFAKFCKATGHKRPEYWINEESPIGSEAFPVVFVSAIDADAYCTWAGVRLPAEEEAAGMDATRPPFLCEWTSTMEASSRVLRGGSWHDASWHLRISNRLTNAPSYRYEFYGFRCASHRADF